MISAFAGVFREPISQRFVCADYPGGYDLDWSEPAFGIHGAFPQRVLLWGFGVVEFPVEVVQASGCTSNVFRHCVQACSYPVVFNALSYQVLGLVSLDTKASIVRLHVCTD